jgi:hypothetical protein
MDGGEIPQKKIGGKQSSNSRPQEDGSSFDAAGADDQLVLSNSEVRALSYFFLLLDRWDRMSTAVTDGAAAPEQTAA